MKEGRYVATTTDKAAAPQDAIKLIRCGCKVACGRVCSCVKIELKCTQLYKECNCVTCANVSVSSTHTEDIETEMEPNKLSKGDV